MNEQGIAKEGKRGENGVQGIAILLDIERCKWYAKDDGKCGPRGGRRSGD